MVRSLFEVVAPGDIALNARAHAKADTLPGVCAAQLAGHARLTAGQAAPR